MNWMSMCLQYNKMCFVCYGFMGMEKYLEIGVSGCELFISGAYG